MKPKVAIFDYRVTRRNPVGSCHLRLLKGLCDEIDFTVFAVEFENPDPQRIAWVRVPALRRPLVLLFLSYHLLAPLCYLAHRLRGACFDLVQMVESNVAFGDICYAHFCHRAYLRHHWGSSRPAGLRRVLRWLDHALHAVIEPLIYRGGRAVVVPSGGLARELKGEFAIDPQRISILPNAIDLEAMRGPGHFDRDALRQRVGIGTGDVALAFVALGQYERKGLSLLLEAVGQAEDQRLKLIVVGQGAERMLLRLDGSQRDRVARQVIFAGEQRDVRPWLWAADAFAFPSSYEVFSLACLEAAAAGLPLLVPALSGVEEYLVDGQNGILIERTACGVAAGIRRLLEMTAEHRQQMGERARQSVSRYGVEQFVAAWRDCYAGFLQHAQRLPA